MMSKRKIKKLRSYKEQKGEKVGFINPSPDCQQCGRCCSNVRIGMAANGPLKEFLEAYLGKPTEKMNVYFKQRCKQLLSDNTCSIYENRPQHCRTFKCKRDLTSKIDKYHSESPSFVEIG